MLSESLQCNIKLTCQQNKSGVPHCNISKSKLTHRLNNFFFSTLKSWDGQNLGDINGYLNSSVLFRWGCYPSVGRLAGRREQKLVFTHISSYVGGTSLLSTLNLENLRCGFECGYALPRLFSPSFFLANSKLHFCSLLLQKTKFSGLKAKDVYHSHPYLKDII